MTKVTLNSSSLTGATHTLAAAPLQVSIDPASNFNPGDVVLVQIESVAGGGDWVTMAGIAITERDTYLWNVKAANYRLKIENGTGTVKSTSSVIAVMV